MSCGIYGGEGGDYFQKSMFNRLIKTSHNLGVYLIMYAKFGEDFKYYLFYFLFGV